MGGDTTFYIVVCCFSFTWVVGASNVTTLPERTTPSVKHDPLDDPISNQKSWGVTSLDLPQGVTSPPSGPYFLSPPNTLVTTRAGQAAALTCIVQQLGNRQVSWIRGRDLHVLSSGSVTFSSDSRVSVSCQRDSWTLTIRYTQPRDAGVYSCQVNTQPPLATWYNLTVIEARATILGKETLYVQAGSTVRLECVVREELLIPGLVLWYQDDRLVDRDAARVSVVTQVTNFTRSTMMVAAARPSDSGNYSCWPSSGRPDSVLVHVIQGEPPAAMQHDNSAVGANRFLLLLLLLPWSLTWNLLPLT